MPQVKLSKRLDVAWAAEQWSAQLPALIEQQLKVGVGSSPDSSIILER